MLVFDRKVDQGFWIDGKTFVKVLSIHRDRVKLGIDAPTDILIDREEVHQRKIMQKRDLPEASH